MTVSGDKFRDDCYIGGTAQHADFNARQVKVLREALESLLEELWLNGLRTSNADGRLHRESRNGRDAEIAVGGEHGKIGRDAGA